jgi:hypothetical protein
MDIVAELGRFQQDSVQAIGGILLALVLLVYWILKT